MKKLQMTFRKEYSFLYVLFFNTLFFIVSSWLLPIRFEENDDVIMLLFSSGKYTGTPEHNLVFINIIWGYFVSFLYSLNLKIEWYTLLFSTIHVLSLTIIIWSFIKEKVNSSVKILFILLFIVFEIRLIILFQFTTTAAISALSGLILLLQNKPYQRVCGLIILVVSSLIRFEASLLTIIVLSPHFIVSIYKNSRIYLTKPLVHLLIAIGFIFLFSYVDKMSYENDVEWKYYKTYNHYRGQINDNPNSSELLTNLPKGIKLQDYQLLLTFLPDPIIINLEKIKQLDQDILNVSLSKKISNLFPLQRSYIVILLLTTMLWLIIFIFTVKRRKRIYLVISIFIFYFVLIYISLNGTLKYRVFLTALMPFFVLLFYSIEQNIKKIYYFYIFSIISLFVLFFSYSSVKIWRYKYNWAKTEFLEQKKLLIEYFEISKKSIVPLGADLSVEYYYPFKISDSFQNNQIFFSGWVTKIPYNRTKLDSHLDLVNKHTLFLDKRNLSEMMPLIIKSIKNNYNKNIISKKIIESNKYVIIEFIEVTKITNP